jgi:lipopolysaccharide transport system ATP-binding protein
MAAPVIEVLDLSKRYSIGQLHRRGHGGAQADDDAFWALRDVRFDVQQGEVVGILGANGAGKSTLLKILSRITEPTSGEAVLFGRVGSLLEVGTGFHPELTGRENVYLNGSIMGMRRREVQRKFDEIVEFSGVEQFIDTPVKRYSSGMYVRLAFAVAAHLDFEILIVDEVLAVGDAAFQRKCLGRMEAAAESGRTVLFVSHNMTTVSQLCSRALLLEHGRVTRDGHPSQVIAAYLHETGDFDGEHVWPEAQRPGSSSAQIHAVRVLGPAGVPTANVNIDEPTAVQVDWFNGEPGQTNVAVLISILDPSGTVIFSTGSLPRANSAAEEWFERPHPVGLYRATCTIPANFLNEGQHTVDIVVHSYNPPRLDADARRALSFEVFDTGALRAPGVTGPWAGAVRVALPWSTEFLGALAEEPSGGAGAATPA